MPSRVDAYTGSYPVFPPTDSDNSIKAELLEAVRKDYDIGGAATRGAITSYRKYLNKYKSYCDQFHPYQSANTSKYERPAVPQSVIDASLAAAGISSVLFGADYVEAYNSITPGIYMENTVADLGTIVNDFLISKGTADYESTSISNVSRDVSGEIIISGQSTGITSDLSFGSNSVMSFIQTTPVGLSVVSTPLGGGVTSYEIEGKVNALVIDSSSGSELSISLTITSAIPVSISTSGLRVIDSFSDTFVTKYVTSFTIPIVSGTIPSFSKVPIVESLPTLPIRLENVMVDEDYPDQGLFEATDIALKKMQVSLFDLQEGLETNPDIDQLDAAYVSNLVGIWDGTLSGNKYVYAYLENLLFDDISSLGLNDPRSNTINILEDVQGTDFDYFSEFSFVSSRGRFLPIDRSTDIIPGDVITESIAGKQVTTTFPKKLSDQKVKEIFFPLGNVSAGFSYEQIIVEDSNGDLYGSIVTNYVRIPGLMLGRDPSANVVVFRISDDSIFGDRITAYAMDNPVCLFTSKRGARDNETFIGAEEVLSGIRAAEWQYEIKENTTFTQSRRAVIRTPEQNMFIPLTLGSLNATGSSLLTKKEYDALAKNSFHITVLVYEKVRLKWYETELFSLVLKFVGFALAIYTAGQSIGAAVAATTVLEAVLVVSFQVAIAYTAGLVTDYIRKEVGGELGAVLGAVIVVGVASIQGGIGFDTSGQVFKSALAITDAVSGQYSLANQEELQKVAEDYAEDVQILNDKFEELEVLRADLTKQNGELSQSMVNLLDRDYTIFESPDDFINRTTDIVAKGLDVIQIPTNFVQLNNTIDDLNEEVI